MLVPVREPKPDPKHHTSGKEGSRRRSCHAARADGPDGGPDCWIESRSRIPGPEEFLDHRRAGYWGLNGPIGPAGTHWGNPAVFLTPGLQSHILPIRSRPTASCRTGMGRPGGQKNRIWFLGSSMVEHAAVNRRVVGSSPTRGAKLNQDAPRTFLIPA